MVVLVDVVVDVVVLSKGVIGVADGKRGCEDNVGAVGLKCRCSRFIRDEDSP